MSGSGAILSFPTRTFQLWLFKPGHRQLLLRSHGDSRQQLSQIDVLFKNVVYSSLPSVMLGLTVREADNSERADLELGNQALSRSEHVFLVQGKDVEGFVAAGLLRHATYEGDFRSDSPVLV